VNESFVERIVSAVRAENPLIHCITNYVTVTDVANILLACGAAPVMADDRKEAAVITRMSAASYINIGTLTTRTVRSMAAAVKMAGRAGHPVILDPVGAGASSFRTKTALRLLAGKGITILRGNMSEIKALGGMAVTTRGVDVAAGDRIAGDADIPAAADFARAVARRTGAVVGISGAIDCIADADRVYVCRNGHPEMERITGTGCMLSAVTAAFCAVEQDPFLAAAAAFAVIGLCGERAYEKTSVPGAGTASFRTCFIDEVSRFDAHESAGRLKLELYAQ
jgi:hydroxyethylthiazole kinase